MSPPRLLLINPNTTAAMTEAMVAQIRGEYGGRATVRGVTAGFGVPVIASRASAVIGAHAALDAWQQSGGDADAVILGCFGDPGLEALREIAAPVPVIGLAEACFDAAAEAGRRFAVLTVGPAWKPMLEERLRPHPAAPLCVAVRALDGTGLDVARQPDRLLAALDTAAAALAEDGAESIILGGAALAGLGPRLRTPVAMVDCITTATNQALRILRVRTPALGAKPRSAHSGAEGGV